MSVLYKIIKLVLLMLVPCFLYGAWASGSLDNLIRSAKRNHKNLLSWLKEKR